MKCFGEKQKGIKMIDLEAIKGYNCVIHIAGRNPYEKDIGMDDTNFPERKSSKPKMC